MNITVLGGGITGLSSAFHLSRRFPQAQITLLEQQPRLGGWVRSEQVQIPDTDQTIVLEAGPRTLRPASKSVLELINLLGLRPEVITTPTSSPAARTRFLHIPGTPGLLPLPTSAFQLLSSPLRSILLPALLGEPFRRRNTPKGDETLDELITRRFGEPLARTLGSALANGVYAADSKVLGARATFPSLLAAEERGWGSVLLGVIRGSGSKKPADYDLGDMEAAMRGVSVYSFRNGMRTLTDSLTQHLRSNPNVAMRADSPVLNISTDGPTITLHTATGSLTPTHVVAALPLPVLHALLPPALALPHLIPHAPASSVCVTSLVFAAPPHVIHPAGFGYLVPRPTRVLGTVFDSCALAAQDSHPAAVTKMTVMLAGEMPMPTPELVRTLEEHLLRALPQPVLVRTSVNKGCIPVLGPGHVRRMEEMRAVLRGGAWAGRLEVVGAGVGGVSVGDCVEAGRGVGRAW